jgi:hypothetical protein
VLFNEINVTDVGGIINISLFVNNGIFLFANLRLFINYFIGFIFILFILFIDIC